jgi:hypothetical protein
MELHRWAGEAKADVKGHLMQQKSEHNPKQRHDHSAENGPDRIFIVFISG